MAYTLQTSGLATALTFCLAVDSDGATVKEFVSADVNANKSIGTISYSAQSWKGTSRGYFATGGSGFSPSGISFPTGHQAGTSDGDIGYFIAFANSGGGSGNNGFRAIVLASGAYIGTDSTTNKVAVYTGSGTIQLEMSIAHPTDGTTPWSLGLNYAYSGAGATYLGNGLAFYYGLASGSTAIDTSKAAVATGSVPSSISYIGGYPGAGTWAPGVHLICQFNRQLTSTEYTSLHNDWFGTLFNAGTVTAVPRMLTLGCG